MKRRDFHIRIAASSAAIALPAFAGTPGARQAGDSKLESIVAEAVRPVIERNRIPGMAVAVTVRGRQHFFNHGVAAKESGRRVSERTIFEIGSVSKTLTATLAAYARETGRLSFSDKASRHLPALAGSAFDRVSLLDLATYVAGGLPLQFPDAVVDEATMLAYLRNWRPAYPAGTHRLYSNPSIGLFGALAARSLGEPFAAWMENKLFPMLGLSRTFIRVPKQHLDDYAFGYLKDDQPIRVAPRVLDAETYGVKTTAADMLRFVEASMGGTTQDAALRRAIAATHAGFYRVGDMTQALGWEMYASAISLERLLAGNSDQMAYKAHEVIRPAPSIGQEVLLNKTGSTNGFGAYVAFLPARGSGLVMLANRNYPIADRVTAAFRILRFLGAL